MTLARLFGFKVQGSKFKVAGVTPPPAPPLKGRGDLAWAQCQKLGTALA